MPFNRMQGSIPRWGLIALAAVMIGAPTVFYAAKWAPFRRAPRAAVNAPRVNAPALDPVALRRKGITDRLGICAKARTAKEKEQCYVSERKKCDQESSEKTWCVQRALVGKLSGTAATCATVRKASERQRCFQRLWKSEIVTDRKALTGTDRQEVCTGIVAQKDRDRCLAEAARQLRRDGVKDRLLCQQIQNEELRDVCQNEP